MSHLTISDKNNKNQKSVSPRAGSSMIRFTFYGQAKPEKEITKDLKEIIENWLEEMTEKQMINLLQRNPKFPFNHIDYRFICSAATSPKKSLTYKLPEFVSDLYLFIIFLKQNIATHLGIHSIRISPDENRLNAGQSSVVSVETDTIDTNLEQLLPKSFRVKMSSEDISFVYFPLPIPRERKFKRKPKKPRPIHTTAKMVNSMMLPPNGMSMDSGNKNTPPIVTDSGTTSTTTIANSNIHNRMFRSCNNNNNNNNNNNSRYGTHSHILSSSTQQPTGTITNTFDAEQSIEDHSSSTIQEDPVYKLTTTFGNGLAVLTCGMITTDNCHYISHAKTCVNPMKSNDLTSIIIKPDRSLKSMVYLLQSLQSINPDPLNTLKGGNLRLWKSTTNLHKQQSIKSLQPHTSSLKVINCNDKSASPNPNCNVDPEQEQEQEQEQGQEQDQVQETPPLLKHSSNSTFFGSASPRDIETDFDNNYGPSIHEYHRGLAINDLNASINDVITDNDDDDDAEVTEDESEEKSIEQRSFAIELWARMDSLINTTELLAKFNAAINQSLHEYAIEWLCILFRNTQNNDIINNNDKDKDKPERLYNIIHSYLVKPITNIMQNAIELSSVKTNLKTKSCHYFVHTFPRMFWNLHKVTKSVLLELINSLPSMSVYVLSKAKRHKIQNKTQFLSIHENNEIFLDEPSTTYIILGGIQIFGDNLNETQFATAKSRKPTLDKTEHDTKLYGPKRLSSMRSALHRHCLFIAFIDNTSLKFYHYNWSIDKINRFQQRMDQLIVILNERCNTFNSIMLHKMGLSSASNSSLSLLNKLKFKHSPRELISHLKAMKSGTTIDSLDTSKSNAFDHR